MIDTNEQFAELDGLLLPAAGLDSAQQQAEDDFADLNAMLAESVAAKTKAAEVKLQRQKLAKGGMGKEERDAVEALVRQWELQREWRAAARVAIFNAQVCQCGQRSLHFQGLYQRQVSTTDKVDRWVKVIEDPAVKLPKEMKVNEEHTEWCPSCIGTWVEAN